MERLISALLVLLLIVMSGCIMQSPQKQDNEKIGIGSFSRAVDYAPYIIAKNKGWFKDIAKKYGKEIDYAEFQSLAAINESFATGNIDIVFEAEAPAIIGKAAGMDIAIKGIEVSLVQEILVHKNSEIKEIKDLKGKKIAVLSGTSSHYGVTKILKDNGLSSKYVELIDMNPPDARAAFETDQVDAWAVWPPWVEQQTVSGKGRVIKGGDAFIQSITAVRNEFAQKNPELLKEILAEIEKTKKWIAENEKDAQEIVSKELGISLEVVKEAWPKHNFQAKIGKKELEDIQAKADFLLEINLIKNKVNAEEFVDLQ
ncbi:MAG: aliphatic sulfonate ABC transporter substrate-binding protein [archaeon]